MRYIFIPTILICFSINGQTNINLIDSSSKLQYDSVRVELEQMFYIDQGLRKIFEDSVGYNSSEANRFLGRLWTIDKINQKELQEILDKYGWLPISKVGVRANEAIFYIIQHSNIDMMDKYFPQLQELAKKSEAKKTDAAMMEDRLLMWKGKKQKYGTQASWINGRSAIWPIEEPDKVDSLRKDAGFSMTILENAHRLNAEYNPKEKLPNKQDK
jgi:hypothetical protein